MDEVDYAQEKQDLYLDIALKEYRGGYTDDPLIVNGKRRCVDCEKIVPQKRLKANPQAVRCIGCQTEKEGKNRRGIDGA